MPSKRVSLKGKGADLFFGDYAPVEGPGPAARAEPGESGPVVATGSEDRVGIEGTAAAAAPLGPVVHGPPPQGGSRPKPRKQSVSTMAQPKPRASTLASVNNVDARTIDAIRKVVKVPGREVSFVRLSPEEKIQLAEIVYAYKRRGQKTTENEINRIALNYLLHDHCEHGDDSMLAKVLAALLA